MLDSDPTVISMRCLLADPGAVFPWHSHAFDEFTLVTDDDTVIGGNGRPGRTRCCSIIEANSTGRGATAGRSPAFWVVHFTADPKF